MQTAGYDAIGQVGRGGTVNMKQCHKILIPGLDFVFRAAGWCNTLKGPIVCTIHRWLGHGTVMSLGGGHVSSLSLKCYSPQPASQIPVDGHHQLSQ